MNPITEDFSDLPDDLPLGECNLSADELDRMMMENGSLKGRKRVVQYTMVVEVVETYEPDKDLEACCPPAPDCVSTHDQALQPEALELVGHTVQFDLQPVFMSAPTLEFHAGYCAGRLLRLDRREMSFGYVYFLRASGSDGKELVKVGFTRNLMSRYHQITRGLLPGHGARFDCALIVAHPKEAERFFHEHFAESRISGEWFALSKEQVKDAIRAFDQAGNPVVYA